MASRFAHWGQGVGVVSGAAGGVKTNMTIARVSSDVPAEFGRDLCRIFGHSACLLLAAEALAMGEERRNVKARAAIVQRVINGVLQNPSVTLSVNTLQSWAGVPMEAAQRILERLVSSGL